MRINLVLIFVLIIFLLSCDKQKKAARKIAEKWEIVTYKVTDLEGLSEYATCSGTMTFDACDNNATTCTYRSQINFVFATYSGSNNENGTFEVNEKGDYMDVSSFDVSNILISKYNYRILTLNKTDLQLTFTDSLGFIYMYIFKRK